MGYSGCILEEGEERKNAWGNLMDAVSSLPRGYKRSEVGCTVIVKWLTLDYSEKQSHSTFGFIWLSPPPSHQKEQWPKQFNTL